MSFTFLLGILACCISAFVSVNRFGFAIEGTWCALDRIYYDIIYGQLPKRAGNWKDIPSDGIISVDDKETNVKVDNFDSYKNFLEKKIYNKLKSLKAFQIISMVYFCLLLITVTFAGISLMFYACLKRQGYLITFMIILWNIIRFFIFSFFLFGTAFGIFKLIFQGSISIVYNIFQYEGENNYIQKTVIGNDIGIFFFKTCISKDDNREWATKDGTEKRNCSFIKTDINLTYRALNDV